MSRFLIDENLPRRFVVWRESDCVHVTDVEGCRTDDQIWAYALANELAVVTKDADFADRLLLRGAPPKVVHLRIGNMRLHELQTFIHKAWPAIVSAVESGELVNVYLDRIEIVA